MSNTRHDDDQDLKNIRPGNIDDLFENDDSLDVNIIPDESQEKEKDSSKESWDEYMVNDFKDETMPNETDKVENSPNSEESTNVDASDIEDNTPVDNSVKTDEPEKPTEMDTIEKLLDEGTEDNDSAVVETNVTNIKESEPIVPEEIKDNSESTTETTDDDDEVSVESVDNDEIANVKDDSEEVEKEIKQMNAKEDEPNKFNPDDIKGPEDEEAEQILSEGGDLTAFMNSSFKARVKNVYENFPEEDILGFLNKAKEGGKEELDVLKDMYIQEYTKYNQYVNFNNPIAVADLWHLVAYEYHSYSAMKNYKEHGTYVEPGALPSDANVDGRVIVEDPNIAAIKNEKKKNAEKYSQYALDHTIFDISDDEEIENSSVFEDKKTLMKDFYESPFYNIIKEVMESDNVADMTNVRCKVTINEQTSYLPVIDFNTGIRCICIDTTDTSQYHINALLMSRKVPFAWNIKKGAMRVRMLYSDACTECQVAIIASLKKLIAYDYIKDRYKVKLNHNYVIAYTTERKYVDMFEHGDPDSKTAGCSTYVSPKASNMALGIIVLDKKSDKDRQSIRRNQFYRDIGNYDPNMMTTDDYNIYFILSVRIIRNDLRLRDPTYPKNERYVEYTIVQYTEHNKSIILDGFQAICACIIKEHMRNYEPGTNYAISYELDRDNLVSPAVVGMIDERDGVELSNTHRIGSPLDVSHQYILPPSRLKMDGVYPSEKGRVDIRFFSPSSIMHVYQERSLWQNYDINTMQGRIDFIMSRGFEEFIIPAPITFDVMPYACDIIETGSMIRDIQKVSIMALSDRNSDDTDNILFKQRELEYIKGLGGNENYGGFQKFLFTALDLLIDYKQQANETTTK